MDIKIKKQRLYNQLLYILFFYKEYIQGTVNSNDKTLNNMNNLLNLSGRPIINKNRIDHKLLHNNGVGLSYADAMTTFINLEAKASSMYNLGIIRDPIRNNTVNTYDYFKNWTYMSKATDKIRLLSNRASELCKRGNIKFYNLVRKYNITYTPQQCASMPIQGSKEMQEVIKTAHKWFHNRKIATKIGSMGKDIIDCGKIVEANYNPFAFVSFSNQGTYLTIPNTKDYDTLNLFLCDVLPRTAAKLNVNQLKSVRKALDLNPKVAKINKLAIIYTYVSGYDGKGESYRYNKDINSLKAYQEKMYQYYSKKYPNLRLNNPISKYENKASNTNTTLSRVNKYDKPKSSSASTSTNYKVCPHCGTKCHREDNFCIICGYRFRN